MESNGQHDSLCVIPTHFHWWHGSACVLVVSRELWVIPHTLSSFSHLFKEIVTNNKFSVELIMGSLASRSPEAEAKMGISARDVLLECSQEWEKQDRAGGKWVRMWSQEKSNLSLIPGGSSGVWITLELVPLEASCASQPGEWAHTSFLCYIKITHLVV